MITMLYQAVLENAVTFVENFKWILVLVIVFLIGTYSMRWYAKKKHKQYRKTLFISKVNEESFPQESNQEQDNKVWDSSLKVAFKVNIFLFLINILIGTLFYFLFYENSIFNLITQILTYTLINVVVGTIAVNIFYNQAFREAFYFVAVVQLILFIMYFLLNFVFYASNFDFFRTFMHLCSYALTSFGPMVTTAISKGWMSVTVGRTRAGTSYPAVAVDRVTARR